MIGKVELLETAAKLGLRPDVVEKDYVLGWTLAGIYAHDELRDSWVFKGGTCLKKCYFETYRFSEDLDFTLKDPAHLDEAFLKRVFIEVGEWIYEQAGVEMPPEGQDFDLFQNPRGKQACQGKLSYRGPISPNVAVIRLPRVKLDLTSDERLVLPPERVPIFHAYSDEPEEGIEVLAYAYEEAFGEKVRALAERTRPRDLYDVVNLYRNGEARPSSAVLLDVLRQKCEFKGIPVPTLAALGPHRNDLEGGWAAMLGHQLPALPPAASFWDVLPEFFRWLAGGAATAPAAYAMAAGETVIRERTLGLSLPLGIQTHLEIIRFAGANRLCVELAYQGSTRRIEPYSLRRTREGNIVLHAHNLDKNEHRNYRVDRIEGARTTNQTFVPRHAVELTPTGPVHVAPSQAGLGGGRQPTPFARLARPRRSPIASTGPTYVYQCPLCQKKFRRKTHNGKLNPHNAPNGWACSGRTGFLIDTQY
ncbi:MULTISPECIES: nucleotidyl transferase AbiEii/AbiGii toxin family protein [Rhodomicrobium]|uniref:nucleotidyl transferase AbiEii/AbiGii toxin family protein n=1 Tax=Rhodomicrobium TaxID=1068 RepID=UPI000B4B11F3|nr:MULTISPECIES: nucleotidyl transferase AbiEii/AbiGii toxin family protein [Rhodomicrobium]